MQCARWIRWLCLLGMTGCSLPKFSASPSTTRTPIITRANGNQLEEMQKSVRQSSDGNKESKPASDKCPRCGKKPCRCPSSSDSDSGITFDNPVTYAVLDVLTLPFSTPAFCIGDDWDHFTEFPDYPYANDVPGSLLMDTKLKVPLQSWTANVQFFTVQGFDQADRYGGRLVLDSQSRFGIDTETNYWTQPNSGGGTTQFLNGDANLVIRFAESEHMQWRAGVGMNWLQDQFGGETGFNFTYGVEWFPAKPWTFSTVFDVGTLGKAQLFHNRSTVGTMLGPVEVFAGYDYFQINSVRIHGPVAGMGWRF